MTNLYCRGVMEKQRKIERKRKGKNHSYIQNEKQSNITKTTGP